MDLVAQQLLRAVRGKRSQVAFARRLGYRGNPIADWEASRRAPTAAEALRACELSGIDVAAAFARFHRVPLVRHEGVFRIGHGSPSCAAASPRRSWPLGSAVRVSAWRAG